jgi:excinuclease ABC subunit C
MNKKDFESSFLPKLPDSPGVYLFKKGRDIIYVGKATSLKQRVRSYFSNDLIKTRGRLLVDMVTLSDEIEFKETDSVLEALILEAHLIKEKQPKYNTKDKDNKSYNYVVITKEDYPRVLVVRGRTLKQDLDKQNEYKNVFGPYPYGGELKEALKIVRKIFPFRDKCTPFVDGSKFNPRPCFNRMIGLCPGVCTGEISKKDYGIQIKNIEMFFEGRKKILLNSLEKQMLKLSKEQKFEKANEIKRSIFALNHIQDVSLIKNVNLEEDNFKTVLGDVGGSDALGIRIEAYDIAHMSGKNMVGTMVVMEGGELKKNLYRKFIINNFDKANDSGALKEMLERRIQHKEWGIPNIVVLDGNEVQLKTAQDAWSFASEEIGNRESGILFCSVVKDKSHKAKDVLFLNIESWKNLEKINNSEGGALIDKIREQIIKINHESHRFTIAFHKKRRTNSFL